MSKLFKVDFDYKDDGCDIFEKVSRIKRDSNWFVTLVSYCVDDKPYIAYITIIIYQYSSRQERGTYNKIANHYWAEEVSMTYPRLIVQFIKMISPCNISNIFVYSICIRLP